MASHSSVLAWRIPGTGEPGGPPSIGSHRVKRECVHLTVTIKNYYLYFNKLTLDLTLIDPEIELHCQLRILKETVRNEMFY